MPLEDSEKRQLLFVGDLCRKANFEEIIGAVPLISNEIKGFHFLVVGGGGREEEYKEIVKQLGIESSVTFTGWVRDRKKLDELIQGSTVGLALYEKYDENGDLTFANFSDPGKIKDYLSAGLPVLVSEVPYNAQIIEEKKCGMIVKPDKNEIAQAVIEIMKDEKTLKAYRENALEYIRDYDWNVIFDKNLTEENLFSNN